MQSASSRSAGVAGKQRVQVGAHAVVVARLRVLPAVQAEQRLCIFPRDRPRLRVPVPRPALRAFFLSAALRGRFALSRPAGRRLCAVVRAGAARIKSVRRLCAARFLRGGTARFFRTSLARRSPAFLFEVIFRREHLVVVGRVGRRRLRLRRLYRIGRPRRLHRIGRPYRRRYGGRCLPRPRRRFPLRGAHGLGVVRALARLAEGDARRLPADKANGAADAARDVQPARAAHARAGGHGQVEGFPPPVRVLHHAAVPPAARGANPMGASVSVSRPPRLSAVSRAETSRPSAAKPEATCLRIHSFLM